MTETKGDLISRSKLRAEISNAFIDGATKSIIKRYIDNAPTVEIRDNYDLGYAEGLEDAKPEQGEWIEGENGCIRCNKCGCEIIYSYIISNKPELPKFCCDCGAKMFNDEGAVNG